MVAKGSLDTLSARPFHYCHSFDTSQNRNKIESGEMGSGSYICTVACSVSVCMTHFGMPSSFPGSSLHALMKKYKERKDRRQG